LHRNLTFGHATQFFMLYDIRFGLVVFEKIHGFSYKNTDFQVLSKNRDPPFRFFNFMSDMSFACLSIHVNDKISHAATNCTIQLQ
jgi:hypothetical protein